MSSSGYLLGFDIGSSSVKACLLDSETGLALGSSSAPAAEMKISAPYPGWAEQEPRLWWENLALAASELRRTHSKCFPDVRAIGLSYQMHGLVLVDSSGAVLRPAIIWCDSRAVLFGEQALRDLGEDLCRKALLNSPGNFTFSKLRWVQQNEPGIFAGIDKMLLPGDYIAYRLTGELQTTASGLSEAILWDYGRNGRADFLLDKYEVPAAIIPDVVDTFSIQGKIRPEAAELLGVSTNTVVSYRAGDQPNNAYSLRVIDPGEVAATAGTSAVIYGVSSAAATDKYSRVNSFVHVNHTAENPRLGILACINGAGSLNRWLRTEVAAGSLSYDEMNAIAGKSPAGAKGLTVLPFGNGAERILRNSCPGAQFSGLDLNRHQRADLFRASQEGIVFALVYGLDIMREMGMPVKNIRAGRGNMFMSPVFCEAFSNTANAVLEMYDSHGAQGAARASGVGAGIYRSVADSFVGFKRESVTEPEAQKSLQYREIYQQWKVKLEREIS